MKCAVFISLVTKLHIDNIVAGIFRLGYVVAPVSTKGGFILSNDDSPAILLSIQLRKADGSTIDHSTLRNQIKTFLNSNNISYFSIVVVVDYKGIAWANSNISLKKINERKITKRKDAPYLRLVTTPPPNDDGPESA